MERAISVLLVEDDSDDARLIEQALRGIEETTFLLDRVDRLASALDWLRRRAPAVILLDLNLPDSRGLETLVMLRTRAPRTAIVVLTAHDGDDGLKAVRAGAQDYLDKAGYSPELLARSLRYAVERQALLNQLESKKARESREDELRQLSAFTEGIETPVSRRLFGVPSLRQASRDVFTTLVRMYGEILDELARHPLTSLPEDVAARVDDVARRLGILSAGPEDAFEIHTMALEVKERTLSTSEYRFLTDRAHLALVELMSRLAAHYRGYTVEARELPV